MASAAQHTIKVQAARGPLKQHNKAITFASPKLLTAHGSTCSPDMLNPATVGIVSCNMEYNNRNRYVNDLWVSWTKTETLLGTSLVCVLKTVCACKETVNLWVKACRIQALEYKLYKTRSIIQNKL